MRPVPGGYQLYRISKSGNALTFTPLAIRSTINECGALMAHLAQPKRIYNAWGQQIETVTWN